MESFNKMIVGLNEVQVMKVRDLNIPRKNKIQNKISKKVANIEIKTIKKLILNPIKEAILFIRGKNSKRKILIIKKYSRGNLTQKKQKYLNKWKNIKYITKC